MQNKSPVSKTLRVGVVGATGKMGQAVCIATIEDPEVELVAAIGRREREGKSIGELLGRNCDVKISNRLEALTEARCDVAVDFTHPDAVLSNARWYLEHGVHSVIGTGGLSEAEMDELRERATKGPANMWWSYDFSMTGAVMMHIAKIAARYLPEVEMYEAHPSTKADSPSGTTVATALELAKVRAAYPLPRPPVVSRELVPGARGGQIKGISVHSLRISGGPGFEQIIFGQAGEQLFLKQMPFTREPMARGALVAVKAVGSRRGFTWGLEPLLGLE